jgi:cytidine deaminase
MEKINEIEKKLLEASKAMDKAYVLWGFKVGVTAKTGKGKILFETVKVKKLEEFLPHPFRK